MRPEIIKELEEWKQKWEEMREVWNRVHEHMTLEEEAEWEAAIETQYVDLREEY